MKRIFLVFSLFLISLINSIGQWYVKKYQVTDINLLSNQQLEESLINSKKDLLVSGCVAGFGGAVFLFFKYLKPGMSEDPTFIEQLIGDEGINKIGMASGIGLLAGGAIASIVYLGRIGRIRSVIIKNYPSGGSLQISPALILNSFTLSSCPGLRLTYNF